ncbi:hypothetical protein ACTFIZ_008463 [Dictyostelium cf. discoideum]
MSLLFTDSSIQDTETELTHLVFQWLEERGFTESIRSLESETRITHNKQNVKLGGQLEFIYNEHKELQESMKNVESVEDEDVEIGILGDGKIHKNLNDVLDNVHSSNILCLRFSPIKDSNIIVTGSTDKTLKITNYVTKEVLNSYTGFASAPFISLDFNPVNPELLLASSVDGSHCIIKIDKDGKGELIQKFNRHKKYVVRVRWSPDGKKFASCSYDKSVSLFQEDQSNQGQFEFIKSWDFVTTVESLIFTPDSKYVIAAVKESNYLHYLDTEGDFSVERYNMNVNGDDHVSFSAMEFSITPDKKYLLVSTDLNRLILFKLNSNKQIRNFYGAFNDSYTTTRNAICPSGKYVFSTSQDNLIYVWEIANQKVIAKLDSHRSSVRELTFSPDNLLLASCGFDKRVTLWSNISD